MNLIEQLGGYAAAKAKCDRANKEGYLLLSVPIQNGFGDIYVHKVEEALLEYRRANNIYEVGDWVFPRAKGSGFRAMQIKKITKTFLYADHLILNVEHWRHATDAEIEAGKRLEVV